jgi:hypothetical protein
MVVLPQVGVATLALEESESEKVCTKDRR